jgi:hypothetical protein
LLVCYQDTLFWSNLAEEIKDADDPEYSCRRAGFKMKNMKNLIFTFAVVVLCSLNLKAQVINKKVDAYRERFNQKEQAMIPGRSPKSIALKTGREMILQDSSLYYGWKTGPNSWSVNPVEKEIKGYTDQGWVSSERYYQWNTTSNRLVDDEEYLNFYDTNGNLTIQVFNRYDTLANIWIPVRRDSATFENNREISYNNYLYNPLNHTWFMGYSLNQDNAAHCRESFFYDWDSDYNFIYGAKMIDSLNSQYLPELSVFQIYDPESRTWVNDLKYVMEYQNDTVPLSGTLHTWIPSRASWEITSKDVFTYSGNLPVKTVTQSWDGSTFADSAQVIQEYNAHQKMTRELNQYKYFSEWLNDTQTLNEYNADQKLTKESSQIWDETKWEDLEQTIRTYSPVNRSSEALYQQYKEDRWVNYMLVAESYDGNDSIVESLFKRWDLSTGLLTSRSYRYTYTYESRFKVVEIRQNWDVSTADWLNYEKEFYYYSLHQHLYAPFTKSDPFILYPNPATHTVWVDGLTPENTIFIFDLNGRQLKYWRNSGNQLDISFLNNGIYLMKIETAAGIINKKIIKR